MIRVFLEKGGKELQVIAEIPDENRRLFNVFKAVRGHSLLSAATILLAKANNIKQDYTYEDYFNIFNAGTIITAKLMTSDVPGSIKINIQNIKDEERN